MKRALLLPLAAIGLTFICSCHAQSNQASSSAPPPTPESSASRAAVKILDSAEPNISKSKPELKQAWASFTSDGRYRLARASDMQFSEPAKFRIRESFSMWQGDLTFRGELAVLVVDNTRDGRDRFGAVIFRRVEKNDKVAVYTPYWLWRDRDLSKTALDRVSGYLFVHEFADGAVYKSCEVKWHERPGRYVCVPM